MLIDAEEDKYLRAVLVGFATRGLSPLARVPSRDDDSLRIRARLQVVRDRRGRLLADRITQPSREVLDGPGRRHVERNGVFLGRLEDPNWRPVESAGCKIL
ncbi:MAG TPA: hypothetical protein VFT80_00535 [Actinomycetota bacterium]|nr:hypothetical protein [Actinomycetota bacterium]